MSGAVLSILLLAWVIAKLLHSPWSFVPGGLFVLALLLLAGTGSLS